MEIESNSVFIERPEYVLKDLLRALKIKMYTSQFIRALRLNFSKNNRQFRDYCVQ